MTRKLNKSTKGILAGVDGGATKTVAIVGKFDGSLLGSGRAPSANYHNVGINSAAESIRTAVHMACRHGGVPARHLETVVIGLAAMDSPRDFVVGRRLVDLTGLGKRRVLVHDSVVALYAATLGRPGVVVNAGTGSFAAGIGSNGNVIRAGGWGNIIDDEGGAYDIGKFGVRAALRALDGRERKTAIARLLVRKYKLRALEDIVHEVYEKPMTVDEISEISRLVAQAAHRGDSVARDIFAREAKVSAVLVSSIARRLGMIRSNPNIYCIGGVFNVGTVITKPFRKALRESLRRFRIRRPLFEPVVGAFVLALREKGVPTSGLVLRNLRASSRSMRC